MFNWWDSIMSFVREWPALIFIAMVAFFIFWVIMIVRKLRMADNNEKELRKKDAEKSALRNLSYEKSNILRLLVLAVQWGGNSCHNPLNYAFGSDSGIGWNYKEYDDTKFIAALDLASSVNKEEGLWQNTIMGLDLIWAVHHIGFLLKNAEERVQNGRRENSGILGIPCHRYCRGLSEALECNPPAAL